MSQFTVKFNRVTHKPGLNAFQAEKDGKSIWVNAPANVINFIKVLSKDNKINIGDEITLEGGLEAGKWNATKLIWGTGTNTPSSNIAQPKTENAAPAQKTTSSYSGNVKYRDPVTPEESERMCRLSVLSSVATMMTALTGQVDPNNVGDIATSLYDKFMEKVKE